jgi:hypothetical protein
MIGRFIENTGMITVRPLGRAFEVIIYDWSVVTFSRKDDIWGLLSACTNYYLRQLRDCRRPNHAFNRNHN